MVDLPTRGAIELIVPNFPFGNRAEASVRACACCCAGNPDMPRSGCGPGPDESTRSQYDRHFPYYNAHAWGQPRNVSAGPWAKKCLGRKSGKYLPHGRH